MQGKPVPGAHAIIRMFSLCENMKWAHLPEPGGLYAQDPKLLEGFQIIFAERAEWQEVERKREESERKQQMGKRSSQRSRASRSRR